MDYFDIFKNQTKTIQIEFLDPDNLDINGNPLPLNLTTATEIRLHVGDKLNDSSLNLNLVMSIVLPATNGLAEKTIVPADITTLVPGYYYAQGRAVFGANAFPTPIFPFVVKAAVAA